MEWIVVQCGRCGAPRPRGRLGFQVWLKNGVVSDTWGRGPGGRAIVPASWGRGGWPPHPHPKLSAQLPSSPGRF